MMIPVTEASQVAAARRLAVRIAGRAGLGEVESGQLAIIATEAASNLVKHARKGQILVQTLEERGFRGVEILAWDSGPGVANLAACLEDGYSTRGTPGTGLGAIRRLSTEFDFHTLPGKGSVLMSRKWPREWHSSNWRSGGLEVPCPGETVCGDAWCRAEEPERLTVLITDGLGHGLPAAEASREAVRLFRENSGHTPAELVAILDAGLRKTRGAVVAVAEIDRTNGKVRFCGLGNISASIWWPAGRRHLLSYNGIAGQAAAKIREFHHEWPEGALLILASDGIATRWHLDDYPGLAMSAPSLIAATLYRDFSRVRDDATVVVVK